MVGLRRREAVRREGPLRRGMCLGDVQFVQRELEAAFEELRLSCTGFSGNLFDRLDQGL